MNNGTHIPYRIPPRGFAMLEVLIAIVVISFGLLGLAGMHAVSLRNGHNALLRSVATNLAYDMADRARANPGTNYDSVTGSAHSACSTTTGCTAAEMAENDVYDWSQAVANSLPSGVGVICKDKTPYDGTAAADACSHDGDLYVVKIWWVDDPSDPTTYTRFVTSFAP